MKATERLTEEHRSIKVMLRIIEQVCEKLETGEKVDPEHFEQILKFIRGFADEYHHDKEEDLLFPEIEKAGLPRDGGPVGVMLTEHHQGLLYTNGMSEAVDKYKEGDRSVVPEIIKNALGYVKLLDEHIDKEDQCLYPMADENLSGDQQKKLLEEFSRVDEEKGKASLDEFKQILSRLESIYLK